MLAVITLTARCLGGGGTGCFHDKLEGFVCDTSLTFWDKSPDELNWSCVFLEDLRYSNEAVVKERDFVSAGCLTLMFSFEYEKESLPIFWECVNVN